MYMSVQCCDSTFAIECFEYSLLIIYVSFKGKQLSFEVSNFQEFHYLKIFIFCDVSELKNLECLFFCECLFQ